jgi:uncharacterized protein YkwD
MGLGHIRWCAAVVLLGCTGCVGIPRAHLAGPEMEQRLSQPVSWVDFDGHELGVAIAVETNRVRSAAGLRPLRSNRRLDEAAALQASTSAMLGHSSHYNPLRRRTYVYERVIATGVRPLEVGENVAATPVRSAPAPTKEAESVWPSYGELGHRIVQQWLESPPHRAALLNPRFTHIGCSAAMARGPMGGELVYSVQVFMTARDERAGSSS